MRKRYHGKFVIAPDSGPRFRIPVSLRIETLIPFLSCSLLLSGCMSLAMQSTWADPGAVTGPNSWRGALLPLGERDASLAIQNDDSFLHVEFATTDPALQDRILKQGIFIWFDPNGEEARKFGIRYPVAWGTMPASMDEAPHTEGNLPGSPGAGYGRPGDDLEIYTDGYKEYERIGKKDAGGIDARVTKSSDTLLCQIRIPLRERARGPYALGAGPGDLIGVGVETRANLTSGESVGSILPFKVWRKVRLALHP
jgi:hypothetical protein